MANDDLRAYVQVLVRDAVLAERERIRQLAIDHDAHYHKCGVPCSSEHSERPFTELLDGNDG